MDGSMTPTIQNLGVLLLTCGYTQALRAKPDDGDAHFRLGVCYRMRSESQHPLPGDFQTAVDHWMTARSLQPNQYIWRRRIEQYGPRRATDRPDRSPPLRVECDIGTPTDANGTSRLLAYALYQVCNGKDKTCRLLRQDIPITITVGK